MKIKIADLRKDAKLSQEQLADAAGVTRPYLSQLENGQRNMSVSLQKRIADALGCDPRDLIDWSEGETEEEVVIRAFRSLPPEYRTMLAHLAKRINR